MSAADPPKQVTLTREEAEALQEEVAEVYTGDNCVLIKVRTYKKEDWQLVVKCGDTKKTLYTNYYPDEQSALDHAEREGRELTRITQ